MRWQGKYLEAASIVQRHQDVVFKSDVCVTLILGQFSMSLQRMAS